jgi:hypothetical protein
MAKCEVPGFFDVVVVNDDLDAAFVRLKGARLCARCFTALAAMCRFSHKSGTLTRACLLFHACAAFISDKVVKL